MSPVTLTWLQVCARRLARHGLARPASADQLTNQVAVMCGAHAQIMSAAELSIAQRVAGATQNTVRTALWTTNSLIKTFGPRGTLHLLPAQDLALWSGALAAIPASRSGQPPQVQLTTLETQAVVAAIADALAEAELTLDELTSAIVARTGPWAGELSMLAFNGHWPRWRQAIDVAANAGVLCFGPDRGRNVTYTNPRRWLPGFRPAAGSAALAGVVKRYLYAYGPATPEQFARWLKTPRPWAEALFKSLAGELEPLTLDGAQAWVNAGDGEPLDEPPRGLRLLPYFDAFVVGCQPREKVFPGRAYQRALANGQAGNFPVLLIDGAVAGVWHYRRASRKLILTVEAFVRLSAAQRRELEQQAARVGEILDGQAELTLGPISVGPHA